MTALSIAATVDLLRATASGAETEGPTGVAGWAISLMETLGAPGVGVAVALENLFPPIPSEIVLPLAGFTASQGTLGLVEVIIWATVGSVVGAVALYLLGAWLGATRLKAIVRRMPLVDVADVERAERWFEKRGAWTVLLGRLVPVFRSLISIPAGLTRMNLWLFFGLTLLGSAVWNTLFIVLGYVLGEQWELIEPWADAFQYVVIGAVVVVIVLWIVFRIRRNRRRRRDGLPVG